VDNIKDDDDDKKVEVKSEVAKAKVTTSEDVTTK